MGGEGKVISRSSVERNVRVRTNTRAASILFLRGRIHPPLGSGFEGRGERTPLQGETDSYLPPPPFPSRRRSCDPSSFTLEWTKMAKKCRQKDSNFQP